MSETQEMRMRIVLGHSLKDWEDLASAAQELIDMLSASQSREAELLSKLHNSEVLAGKLYKDNVELNAAWHNTSATKQRKDK